MLVKNCTWNNFGMQGCCGAHVISRLQSIDITESMKDISLEHWYNNVGNCVKIIVPSISQAPKHYMPAALKALAGGPTQVTQGIPASSRYLGWDGGAVPVHLAFASVLASIPTQSIVFLADNMSEEGDVHFGEFTTRKFSRWFEANDLGFRITGGPVQSRRTSQDIQGWILHPNWGRCNTVISQAHEDLKLLIKELNSDPRVKERAQEAIHNQARATRAMQASLSGGW